MASLEARTPNPFPHFGSPTSQGMSPSIVGRCYRPAISRRQYLSRMDRFQHGRSGANFKTTTGGDQSEIARLRGPAANVFYSARSAPKCCTARDETMRRRLHRNGSRAAPTDAATGLARPRRTRSEPGAAGRQALACSLLGDCADVRRPQAASWRCSWKNPPYAPAVHQRNRTP